jgi:protoporphyrinogen oxidase
MSLRLRRPLSPYYWINVGDGRFPFAVVVEHTNWMDGDDARGEHLAYLSRYVDSVEDFAWSLPDHELLARYCDCLRRMFADFREADILGFHVCRDRYSQPVFTSGFSARKPPFATPLRGLFLVNTSQFYPHSRCLDTSFILAREFLRSWPEGEGRE